MPSIHPFIYLFLLFWVIRVYFLIAYFFKLALYKPENQDQSVKSGVSVIICAHNEYHNLKLKLTSILEQDYSDFEVIVVDDRSEDGTHELLLSYQKRFPHLKMIKVKETNQGANPKKNALSIGISSAQNEIILLTDADCAAKSKLWIDKMAQCYKENTEIVLGASLYEKKKSVLNHFIQFETIQTAALYLSFALKREPYMGIGRNLSYKKSFFLRNNGFNDHLSVTGGDDDLLVNKHANNRNTEICITTEATIFSSPKNKWGEYLVQKIRHLSVGKYYNKKDQMILGLYHFSQVMLWIFFIFVLFRANPLELLISSMCMIAFWIGQYVVFNKLSTNFGARYTLRWLPIMEMLFIFYYCVVGAYALLSKKVKWK